MKVCNEATIDGEKNEMSVVDRLLNYFIEQDKKILITTDIQISKYELNVVVIQILSWLFHDNFWIKDGKFDFSDMVSEEERKKAREKVYQNYNPQRNIL